MLSDDVKALLGEAARIGGALDHREPVKRPRYHADVLAIFDRCNDLFRAIWVLAEKDFGEAAVQLDRSLMTDSLMLMEVASVDQTRQIEVVVGWALAGLANFKGVLLEAESRGTDVTKHVEAIDAQERDLRAYAARHGAGSSHWKADEKSLTTKHGRDDYVVFRLTHHFVHGSIFVVQQRYSSIDGVVVVGGPGSQQTPWVKGAALHAALSLLHAVEACAAIIGKEKPVGLDDLRRRIDAAAED